MGPQAQPILELMSQPSKLNNNEIEIGQMDGKVSPKRVHLRRDVVNKAIIRAFKKFYNKLFKHRFAHKGKSKDYIYNKCASIVKRVLKSSESYQVLLSQVNNKNSKSKSVDVISRFLDFETKMYDFFEPLAPMNLIISF